MVVTHIRFFVNNPFMFLLSPDFVSTTTFATGMPTRQKRAEKQPQQIVYIIFFHLHGMFQFF